MDNKKLSIIIVNYKSKKFLFDCIQALEEKIAEVIPHEIIVVNNEGKELTETKIKGSTVAPFIYRVIPSYEIHITKPSLEFFKKVLKSIKTKPDECIFIDDSNKNITSAQELGIDSILFQNSAQLSEELKKRKII